MNNIRYLQSAHKDLRSIITYIAKSLKAPIAANNLLTEVENAILQLSHSPYIGKVYNSTSLLDYDYRFYKVKNYYIFYVIFTNYIEIHRVVHSKMNFSNLF